MSGVEAERAIERVLALAKEWDRPLNGMRQRANTGEQFAAIRQEEQVRQEHAAFLRAAVRGDA